MEGEGQGGAGGLAHTAGGAAGKDQSQQQVTCRPLPPESATVWLQATYSLTNSDT